MRILFTGGGTGGHFYPIIAVAKELNDLVKEKKLLAPELFYMSPTPIDEGLLFEHGITYKKNTAGKLRRYFSLRNFTDAFKTLWGIASSLKMVYKLYPDVIFSKGGYASFPVVVAAKVLRIPLVIHESDTIPGKVSLWGGKFAKSIAVSYPEAGSYFKGRNVVYTGNPVREDIMEPIEVGSRDFLQIEENVPVVLILGGSQGARAINDIVIEALPELVEKYVVVHQTGKEMFKEARTTGDVVLLDSKFKNRYKPFDFLNALALRMAAGVSSVVVSRAGSTIFEIASWGKPSILIPIPEETSHNQKTNAFAYARNGGAVVIEEHNLTPNILVSEIDRIVENPEIHEEMKRKAKEFFRPTAARQIAEEILSIALSHEIENE